MTHSISAKQNFSWGDEDLGILDYAQMREQVRVLYCFSLWRGGHMNDNFYCTDSTYNLPFNKVQGFLPLSKRLHDVWLWTRRTKY